MTEMDRIIEKLEQLQAQVRDFAERNAGDSRAVQDKVVRIETKVESIDQQRVATSEKISEIANRSATAAEALRKLDGIVISADDIADAVKRIEETSKALDKNTADLDQIGEMSKTLESTSGEVKKITEKFPWATAFAAALLLVSGISWVKIGDMSRPLDEAKSKVIDASTKLETANLAATTSITNVTGTVGKLQTVLDDLEKKTAHLAVQVGDLREAEEKRLGFLSDKIKANLDSLTKTIEENNKSVIAKVEAATTGLKLFDDRVSKVSYELTQLGQQIAGWRSKQAGDLKIAVGPEGNIFAQLAAGMNDLPASMRLLMAARKALEEENDPEKARDLAVQAKAADKEPSPVYDGVIGQAYYREHKYKESATALERAISLEKGEKVASLRVNLGATYYAWANKQTDPVMKKELLEKAEKIEAEGVLLEPNSPVACVNRVITLSDLGRFDEALKILDDFKEESTAYMDYIRAQIHVRKKDPITRALEALAKAGAKDRTKLAYAALDPEFIPLRQDEDFLALLKKHLKPSDVQQLIKTWSSETGEKPPGGAADKPIK